MSDTYQHAKICQLFRFLNQAEIESQQVQKHSIVLMGLSRSGKSAITNWLFDPTFIVGKKIGTNVFYVPVQQLHKQNLQQAIQIAKIGHGFASVTIMPNMKISQIDKESVLAELAREKETTKVEKKKNLAFKNPKHIKQQKKEEIPSTSTSFLDFGGYGERRNVFQIMKVNYVLASFLLKISKLKFILVITEHTFNDISSNGLRDTFGQFLRLFDFDMMAEQTKKNFFRSVSLCITSATKIHDRQSVVQQLEIIKKNFQDESLYDKQTHQNTYIQKYPLCQRLLEELINSCRFQQFPIALPSQPPPQSFMIKNLNARGWQYFHLEKYKYTISYPYVEQYYRLKENDRNKLNEIFLKKFEINKTIKLVLANMISARYKDLFNDRISFKEQLQQLQTIFSTNNIYSDLPHLFPDQTKGRVKLNWLQRIDTLIQLNMHSEKLQLYNNWLSQRGNQNNQDTKDSLVKYYEYMAEWFHTQMLYIQQLFGSTPQQRQIFKKIQFLYKKTFNQALIFQNLNNNIQERGSDIANQVRMTLLDRSALANQFAESPKSIKLQALAQLAQKQIQPREITSHQALQIISTLEGYEREYKEIDSLQVYNSCFKYAICGAKESIAENEDKKSLNYLVMGLEYCVKQHVCVQIIQDKDNPAEQQLLANQKLCVEHLIEFLKSQNSKHIIQLAMRIAKILKQHTIVDSLYQFFEQKIPVLHDFYSRGQFYLSIGKQNEAISCFQKFLSPLDLKQKANQIKDQAFHNYARFVQANKEEKQIMPRLALLEVIRLIKQQILGESKPSQLDIQSIAKNYRNKIGLILKDKAFMRNLPKNPTNYQFLFYSNDLIKHVTGKKLTIMLKSRPQNGQTTLAYALAGSTLTANSNNNDYCFELLDSRSSKINNNGDNPTEYPNLFSIDQDQILVDFVNINQSGNSVSLHKNNVDKKVLASIMLQKLILNSSQVRFMLVQSQKGFLQTNGAQIVKLINTLSTFFAQEQVQKLLKNPVVTNAIFLAFTNVTNSAPISKKLKTLSKQLAQKSKIVDNERQFSLNQTQQTTVSNILKAISIKGRIVTMPKASKQEKTFKKENWVNQLEKLQAACNQCKQLEKCTHNWIYLPKTCLREKISSKLIGEVFLPSQFEAFSKQIISKIGVLNQIFESWFKKMEKQFERQFCDYVPSQQIQKIDKYLATLNNLYKIKFFFAQFGHFQLPEAYPRYYSMIKSFRNLFFAHIKQNCTSFSQRQINEEDQLTSNLMEQLQEYSQRLELETEDAIRRNLNEIRDFQMRLQGNIGQNYFDQLSKYFLKYVPLKLIIEISSRQSKERLLKSYDEVWTIIGKYQCGYSNIPRAEWLQVNKQLKGAQVENYSKMGKRKQLLRLLVNMLSGMFEECDGSEDEELSIKESTDAKIEQISQFLKTIAKQVDTARPELAQRICQELNDPELLEEIYELRFQNKKDKPQKLRIMVQRISLALEMGHLETAKKLHKKLLSFTEKSTDLLTVKKIRDYANKNKLTVKFGKQPKVLTMERLREFAAELQKETS